MKPKIGVIGLGVVGGALYKALRTWHNKGLIVGYDKDSTKTHNSWSEILECHYVFICVPTDKGIDGRLDVSIVNKVTQDLQNDGFGGICIIKSTLKLGCIDSFINNVDYRIIVFPEWLYANNPYRTTIIPEMTVIGVQNEHKVLARMVLNNVCKWHKGRQFLVKPEEAVMVKLTANALAATKISFANQIQMICNAYGIDSDTVMDIVKTDPRCAARYLTPGNSFGGYCLPKDTSELLHSIDDAPLFKSVIALNEMIKNAESNKRNKEI